MPREITEWDWYCDANTFRVFMHLVICANHVPETWRGLDVERGQIVTGRDALSKALGLSPQEIRTSLDKLKLSKDIISRATNKFTIITICDYEKFNGDTRDDQPAKVATSNSTNNATSNPTNRSYANTGCCMQVETNEQPAYQPALQPQTRRREVENTTTTKTTTRPKRVNALDLEVLPQALRRDVILAFVESRKALRKPLTQRALLMCCKDAMRCQEMHGIDPNDAMEKAIGKGWMTCDPEYFSSQKKTGKPSTGSDKHGGFSEKDYGAGGLI